MFASSTPMPFGLPLTAVTATSQQSPIRLAQPIPNPPLSPKTKAPRLKAHWGRRNKRAVGLPKCELMHVDVFVPATSHSRAVIATCGSERETHRTARIHARTHARTHTHTHTHTPPIRARAQPCRAAQRARSEGTEGAIARTPTHYSLHTGAPVRAAVQWWQPQWSAVAGGVRGYRGTCGRRAGLARGHCRLESGLRKVERDSDD